MTFRMDESSLSRKITLGDNPSILIEVNVSTDTPINDWLVIQEFRARLPDTLEGLVLKEYALDPVHGTEIWKGTATYGNSSSGGGSGDTNGKWSFTCGTENVHVTHSLANMGAYPASGVTAIPNFKGAINAEMSDGEISFAGLDVQVPTFEWEESHTFSFASFNVAAYVNVLYYLTGKINSTAWRGFAPYEVRFLGASGAPKGQTSVTITYRFAASPNVTNLTVGTITGIAKAGWDYLWIYCVEDTDPTTYVRMKTPKAAYVERVFESVNFALLQIPTLW